MIFRGVLIIFAFTYSGVAFSQTDTIYNTKALEKIPYYEQLYRFKVWREISFKEKQNAVFTSPKSNFVAFLLDNLKEGNLKAYAPLDFDFANEIPVTDAIGMASSVDPSILDFDKNKDYQNGEQVKFKGKVYTSSRSMNSTHPPSDAEFWRLDRVTRLPAGIVAFDPSKNYNENDVVSFGGKKYTAIQPMKGVELPTNESAWTPGDDVQPFFTPSEVTTIQLVEDVIFDKRRSRLYYDIIGFVILNPADGNPSGLINFKEFHTLVDRLSHDREMRIRNTVKWKNRYNPSQDMSFNDAFKLRMFHGVIYKVENPDDLDITRIITDNGSTFAESIFARWEEEMKMMEKEHNLWEY